MKKPLLLFLLLFISFFASAQMIYSVDYASQADIKVFVCKYASQADLLVYKVKYKSQIENNDGKWFFVETC